MEVPVVETPMEIPAVEETPKEVPIVEETPMEVPVVETPMEIPVVEETPKEVPVVEETPKEVPVVEETPKEVPVVEETPKEVPVVEETPKEVPIVEETPKEVPVVEETPMEVPVAEIPMEIPVEKNLEESLVAQETQKEVSALKEKPEEVPVSTEAPGPMTDSKVVALEQEVLEVGETDKSQRTSEVLPTQKEATDFSKTAANKPSNKNEKPVEKEHPLQKESSESKVTGVQGETVSDIQVVGKAMENKVVPVHSSVGDVERSSVTASSLEQSKTRVTEVIDVNVEDQEKNVRANTPQDNQNSPHLSSPKVGFTCIETVVFCCRTINDSGSTKPNPCT